MLNLGDLRFGLGVDTRGLSSARSQILSFSRTVQGAQTAANRGFKTNIDVLRKQENSILNGINRIQQAQARINGMKVSPEFKSETISKLNDELAKLTARMRSTKEGLDPTKIDRANASFTQAVNAINATAQAENRRGAAHEKAARAAMASAERTKQSLFAAGEAARNMASKIENSPLTTKTSVGMTDQLQQAYARFQRQMSQPVSTEQAKQFEREWRRSLGNINREFRKAFSQNPDQVGDLRMKLRGLGDAALLVNGHLGGMSTRMFALSGIMRSYNVVGGLAVATTVGLAAALGGLTVASTKAFMELEKATKPLETIMGSSQLAGMQLDYVKNVANQTGLVFTDLAQGYARFLASAQAGGLTLDTTQDVFQRISLAAGKMNLSIDDTKGVLRALDQMLSKGTVQAEELRGQLGDRLPMAMAAAAKAMDMPLAQLNSMLKKGEVVATEFVPAFAKALTDLYGINMDDQVDTLQASINRTRNALLEFLLAFERTFNIGKTVKTMFEGIASSLTSLTANMTEVAAKVAALGGALVGLGAAFVAAKVIGYGTALWALVRAASAAQVASNLLAAAQWALNAALGANPILRIVTILGTLAAALMGAKVAYDAVKGSAMASNAQMSNVSGIVAQLEAQKELGVQVRSTTNAYREQIQAMAIQAGVDSANTYRALRQAEREAANGGSEAGKLLALMTPGIAGAAVGNQAKVNADKRVQDLRKQLREQAKYNNELARAQVLLRDINQLPVAQDQNLAGTLDKDGGGSKADAAANKLKQDLEQATKLAEDFIFQAQRADAVMEALLSGPDNVDLIEDMFKVKDALRDMNDAQMGQIAKVLGVSLEEVELRLTALGTQARVTKDQSDAFTKSWKDLDSALNKHDGIESVISALKAGATEKDLGMLEAVTKANEALKDLNPQTTQGATALKVLHDRLLAAGFAGEDAASSLSILFNELDRGQDKIRALIKSQEMLRDVNRTLEDQGLLANAYSMGNGAGEAMERFLKMRDSLRSYSEELEAAGIDGDIFAAKMSEMAEKLLQVESNSYSLAQSQEKIRMTMDLVRSSMEGAIDSIYQLAEGSKNLGEVLTDFFLGIARQLADNQLSMLFDQLMDSIFGGFNKGNIDAASLIAASTAAKTTSGSLVLLANSAIAAAGALANIGSGGGGGGILGSAANLAGALLAKGAPAGSYGPKATGGAGFIGPRAFGGPVTHGWAYQVNEQGVKGDEIFIPGTSGTIVPQDKLGGGSTVMIDARTTVDARGASVDAIKALERSMLERDARLKAQLPSLIDTRVIDSQIRRRFNP